MIRSRRISAILGTLLTAGSAWLGLLPVDLSAQRGDVEVTLLSRFDDLPEELVAEVHLRRALLRAARLEVPALPEGGRRNIMLTGYWPPTNEMLRRFSTDPVQNPDGWVGSDWEGRGYDVHSFFPEFSPPDCNNCGRGMGDMEVDYQDTSVDFRQFATELEPIALITFSRGFIDLSWEVEMNQFNRQSWIFDFQAPFFPTPSPPDRGVPAETLRLSGLPVREIVEAVDAADLGLNPYICLTGDGGGFLSEFAAYHGVWYQALRASPAEGTAWAVTGGHVHVGGQVDWATATQAAEITVRTVIDYVDSIVNVELCQEDLGFAGPGTATVSICGDALRTGGEADLLLRNGPPNATAWVVIADTLDPRPIRGGVLAPNPPDLIRRFSTNLQGQLAVPIRGGGSGTRYVQVVYEDANTPEGFGFSNALALEYLP